MLVYRIESRVGDEGLSAKLCNDNVQWGEIFFTTDMNGMKLVIYPDTEDDFNFDYHEFLHIVTTAGQHLWGLKNSRTDLPS